MRNCRNFRGADRNVKLILACVIAIASMMIGRAYASGGARRARLLSGMMDALQIMRVMMLDRLMPLKTVLVQSASPVFRCIGKQMEDSSAADAWRDVRTAQRQRGGLIDCLAEEDLCALDALFEGLGVSGRAQQEVLISNALKAFGCLEAEARKNGLEKSRLYTTLGLLAGIAIAIAFI